MVGESEPGQCEEAADQAADTADQAEDTADQEADMADQDTADAVVHSVDPVAAAGSVPAGTAGSLVAVADTAGTLVMVDTEHCWEEAAEDTEHCWVVDSGERVDCWGADGVDSGSSVVEPRHCCCWEDILACSWLVEQQ